MMIHRLSSSSLYVGKTKCVCVHKLPRFFSIQLKLVFLDAGQQQLACPLFSFCDSFEKFSANYLSKEEETRATVRLLIPFVSPHLFRYWGGGIRMKLIHHSDRSRRKKMAAFFPFAQRPFFFYFPFSCVSPV